MRKPHTPPRDVPCDFRANEAFFSCTDRRGIIQAGNAVFTRVSGYAESELIGQPHNLIRHPDVPRAVFQLLWDNLLRGQPIAAYVKNLAKDGRYYWVLALVSPAEGGFLSIRIKPSSQLQPVVESLYREMGAIEAAHADEKAGMAAAAAHLQQALRKLGFTDYDAFMRLSLLREELNARDAILQREQLGLFATLPAPGADPLLGAIHEACHAGRSTYEQLRVHYTRVNDLAELNSGLTTISRRILGLTADFGIVAFNVALKASKLGHEGMGIAVIAGHLNESSARIGGVVRDVAHRIDAVSERLAGAIFNLAWSRLQFEMAVIYYHEIRGELGPEGRGLSARQVEVRLGMMQRLRAALAETGGHARRGFEELARELAGLSAHSEELDRIMTALQVAQVGGLVEASRLSEDAAFSTIFAEVRTQIEGTKKELRTLEDIVDRLHGMAREASIIGGAIQKASTQLQADGRRLAEARAASAARVQPEEANTAPTPGVGEQAVAPAEALAVP
jgi:aerotaxis receptor